MTRSIFMAACCVAALLAPPDVSRDANVSIVARGGNSWETSIAISPANPRGMVLAVIDITDQARVMLYRSADGGATWSDPQPAPRAPVAKSSAPPFDPVLAADADGTFSLARLLLVAPKAAPPPFQG